MQTSICYKHKMEPFLFLKLAKVEILTLIIIGFCCLKLKEQTSSALKLTWPLLLGFVYWQLVSPEQWSSIDGNFSLTKWQFSVKFCLVIHAAVCWSFTAKPSCKLLAKWLAILLLSMLLVIPAKPSATISACLFSHLFIFIFMFNRKKRTKNMIISAVLISAFSGLFWWFSEPVPFISFMQWLPILSLLFFLGLLNHYCKNHRDTELKEFVFYCVGLLWILALHFCILKTVAWSSSSINADIAVLAKIGLAWVWVLLGFQWCLPPNKSTHGYSLLIPFGLILTLFIQVPQAKTFQALMVSIPMVYIQFWWLGHCYQSSKPTDLLESVLLLLNCLLVIILVWWLEPVGIGLWDFSPTLVTLFSLALILAVFGVIRRRKIKIKINYKAFICGLLIALGLGYFISTVSSELYLHIRDEYKESTFILEPVKS